MIKLEQLERKMRVNGIVPEQTVELLEVERTGPNSVSRSLSSRRRWDWREAPLSMG